jgi:ApeA N-terminal domain 1
MVVPRIAPDLRSPNGILNYMPAIPDKETFVRRIVKTRNHLTHLGDDLEHVLTNPARYWHGQALAWLVRI